MPEPLEDNIRENAQGPKRARGDASEVEQHPLADEIAADGHSADEEASPEVRRALRERARYEVANNSYAKGIVVTLVENPGIDHDIQIDVALVEADRVTSDLSVLGRSDEVDGIRLDAHGNPVTYRVRWCAA